MLIKVDIRENELLVQIKQLVLFVPIFKQIKIVTENLHLGDFIIADEKEDIIIIERKTISDILASIKDGRYTEQSYRLNGLKHHNHNIIYLIEGDVNKVNRFKSDNKTEKLTAYSAMFSLNYFKGFSVLRTFTMEETALMICNMAYKLGKDTENGKKGFYSNITKHISTPEIEQIPIEEKEIPIEEKQDEPLEQTDKDYIEVIKKVKKENITPDNIGEIMLCQIPGISTITSLAIMDKFKTFAELIKQLELNNDCLKDLSYTNAKGQTRKINKTCLTNIVKYLLKK